MPKLWRRYAYHRDLQTRSAPQNPSAAEARSSMINQRQLGQNTIWISAMTRNQIETCHSVGNDPTSRHRWHPRLLKTGGTDREIAIQRVKSASNVTFNRNWQKSRHSFPHRLQNPHPAASSFQDLSTRADPAQSTNQARSASKNLKEKRKLARI